MTHSINRLADVLASVYIMRSYPKDQLASSPGPCLMILALLDGSGKICACAMHSRPKQCPSPSYTADTSTIGPVLMDSMHRLQHHNRRLLRLLRPSHT